MRGTALAIVGALTLLCGCAPRSYDFVRDEVGPRAASKGRIVEIGHAVITESRELSDGMACFIANPDCRIRMKVGEEISQYDLRPGDFFVLAEDGDWVAVTRPPAAAAPK